MTVCEIDGQDRDLSPDDKWKKIIAEVKEEYLNPLQKYPWIIGFSGGKDSTLLVQAVFEAVLSITPSKRTRPVHIVSNDTLVESPLVLEHLEICMQKN